MKGLGSLAYGLAVLQTFVSGASIPRYFKEHHTTPINLNATQVQRELGRIVSRGTVIFGPDDSRYDNATARWNMFAPPQVQVIIEPAEERDVSTIVSTINRIVRVPVN